MIVDTIKNAGLYKGLNPDIDRVLEECARASAESFETGRQVLDGDRVFINHVSYETKAREDSKSEAHRLYVDVMYMVEGSETIYVKPTDRLKSIVKEYDPAIEALIAELDGDTTAVRLDEGMFCILYPDDSHAPGCVAGEKMTVKKYIGKVKIN